MSRRAQSLPPELEKPERSRCLTAICFSWKVITCIVSHVTLVSLVVAYCIGGALLFQHLEGEHEVEVKKNIKKLRNNVTDDLWIMTKAELILDEDNWTDLAFYRLEKFEKEILKAVKTEGWDGDEREQQLQWTFFGALFYSIIVITTIGYGHIAPRTDWGKVTTIFYAILGIPLMLLCLSNIGDVMASSFRFLYWKICCYACTRAPPRRRPRSSRGVSRQMSYRYSSRSQPPPTIRRSIRVSQRSADSGFVPSNDAGLIHAYSDPELRYHHNFGDSIYNRRGEGVGGGRDYQYSQEHEIDNYRNRNHMRGNENRNYWQPRSPNAKRFSNRSRNRERMHGSSSPGRGIAEMDCWDNSLYDLDTVPTKRVHSSRSLRGQSVGPSIGHDSIANMNRVNSRTTPLSTGNRCKSLPRQSKLRSKSVEPTSIALGDTDNAPVFCNRYALERRSNRERRGSRGNNNPRNHFSGDGGGIDGERRISGNSSNNPNSRCLSVPVQRPRFGDRLDIPQPINTTSHNRRRQSSYCFIEDYEDDVDVNDDEFEMKPIRKENNNNRSYGRREKPAPLPPSPRIMSPMGFAVHRQARLSLPDEDDSYYGDEWGSYGDLVPRNRPVPIWLCVFLVISYIIAGAFLFSNWEKWPFLDSVYFCFITLTTIGFGDFVPAQGVKENSKESIALCSLYLLFGISLLAMSFNLVQEEVITNVKEVARRLGILKEEEIDD